MTLAALSLFSGIGGFDLAGKWAGIKTEAFCEVDDFCCRVLRKNFGEDIIIHRDIRDLDGKEYFGKVNIVTGGFPCQPFSVAGKRNGTSDNRYLWPEMLRVIKESRPTWVIGENVTGIINLALEKVCTDLESEGYEVQPIIIPASGTGASHKRERVWILANSDSRRCTQCYERIRNFQFPDKRSRWEAEPILDRVVNGVSSKLDWRNRITSLGNAIVPQIAYIILKCISEIEENEITNS